MLAVVKPKEPHLAELNVDSLLTMADPIGHLLQESHLHLALGLRYSGETSFEHGQAYPVTTDHERSRYQVQ